MSATTDNGGPAFPITQSVDAHGRGVHVNDSTVRIESIGGMSLRDWFAGQALAGFCADPGLEALDGFDGFASDAYAAADAMLKARKAKP